MTEESDPTVAAELPRWRQIELSILKEIEIGALKVGDRLAGENALAPHYGVTRTTVRRALSELQNKGVVRIEQGRGSFVERRLHYALGPKSSFKANLRDANLVGGATILRSFEIGASAEVAERLRLSPGSPVVVFHTLGEASGQLVSLTRHHLPAERFPGAIETTRQFSCITEVYRKYGFRSTRRTHCEISARLPTEAEARRLDQPHAEPLLEVRSIKTSRKLPIDFTVACFSAARVSVFFDN